MEKCSYHFIGIGGIGMSGLARIALQKGDKVSGSDACSSAVTQALQKEGAHIFIGHNATHVQENCQVVYSTGVSSDNSEMQEAQRKNLSIIHRSQFLAQLMEGSYPLLVTGTHGKTTTSSLLAHMLVFLGEDPSYSIGGIVQGFKSNGGFGKGKWFVAEADESDRSFLAYTPHGAILTNIGIDHLNYWDSEENLVKGFYTFYEKVQNKDLLFWCADDERLVSLNLKGTGYGFSEKADLRIEKVEYLGWKSVFNLKWNGKEYLGLEIPMIGAHSVLNATAVIGLCLKLGFEEGKIKEGLSRFSGVQRRVEKKGEAEGITVYDDYGHHPTEIASTLQAIKKACEGSRIIVVFQPHRYTRTRDCFMDFAPALQKADVVVLTDIYSAGESAIEHVDSGRLLDTFEKQHSSYYIPQKDLLDKVLGLIKPGDVLVSMGAGDITKIGPQILERLSSR